MKHWLKGELEEIDSRGLLRSAVTVSDIGHGRVEIGGRRVIDLASNDYLGLSNHPEIKRASIEAIERWGCSSRASRLMSGSLAIFDRLERAVANFQGTDDAICLGNGYIANSTIIPALVGKKDVIFMDRSCHASMVDGVLLSGARFYRFLHNDTSHLEQLLKKNRDRYRHALILIETVYSMDGDIAPVDEICEIKEKYRAFLLADEAHALGIFGDHGEGIISRKQKKIPEIIIGTFGKALGSYGAFAACSRETKSFLLNRCRGFIFSTAPPPSVAAANLMAIEILSATGIDRKQVLTKAEGLRGFLRKRLGKKTRGASQIVPLILEDITETVELEKYLFEHGIFVRSIRPPSVPINEPRIRFSITAKHSEKDIEKLQLLLEKYFLSS